MTGATPTSSVRNRHPGKLAPFLPGSPIAPAPAKPHRRMPTWRTGMVPLSEQLGSRKQEDTTRPLEIGEMDVSSGLLELGSRPGRRPEEQGTVIFEIPFFWTSDELRDDGSVEVGSRYSRSACLHVFRRSSEAQPMCCHHQPPDVLSMR